nr:MAG TPA: hypothetical protein [Caudoviricetes sp.]
MEGDFTKQGGKCAFVGLVFLFETSKSSLFSLISLFFHFLFILFFLYKSIK